MASGNERESRRDVGNPTWSSFDAKTKLQKPCDRAAVGLLERTVGRVPQRERRGQRGARGEDAPVHLIDEHERELGVDAELPELHLQADGPGLGLGVRLARARERLADVARCERVADEDHDRVGAFEHLRRVRRAGVGGGDTVAEEGDGAPLQLDDTILGRRAREVRPDVGPARDGGGGSEKSGRRAVLRVGKKRRECRRRDVRAWRPSREREPTAGAKTRNTRPVWSRSRPAVGRKVAARGTHLASSGSSTSRGLSTTANKARPGAVIGGLSLPETSPQAAVFPPPLRGLDIERFAGPTTPRMRLRGGARCVAVRPSGVKGNGERGR